MTDSATPVDGGAEATSTKEDIKKDDSKPSSEQATQSSTSEAPTSTQSTEPAKEGENASQTASPKTPNGGFRQGGGSNGGAGKRVMMPGYRPMYPVQMKSEICQDFAKGTCARGLHCPFLHVAPAGSANALAMTRGTMNHTNTQKNTPKTDGQPDGPVKKSSKKKKKKNAKKAQENAAAEGGDAHATSSSSASVPATTSSATTTEGEEKTTNTQDQSGKGKKSKNQRRQNATEGGANAGTSSTSATDSTPAASTKQTGRKHRPQGGGGRQMTTVPNVGNAVCVNYVLGTCRYGRSCEFLHPEGALNPMGMVCPFYAAGSCGYGLYCIFAHILPTDPGYHLKPCLMNRMGTCPNGDSCVFYHEKPNPRRALDSRSSVTCSFWARGYCSKGENCPFAHPDEYWAMQSPYPPTTGTNGDDQQQKSKDQSKEQKNKTGKGESSTSSSATATVPKSQILCKFWAQGKCPAGDKCEYRHDLFLHPSAKP